MSALWKYRKYKLLGILIAIPESVLVVVTLGKIRPTWSNAYKTAAHTESVIATWDAVAAARKPK